VSSCLDGSAPRPIASTALESALGRDTIDKIASKAGLPFTTASSALAFLLPNIIQKLTPSGMVPMRLPMDIVPSFSSSTNTVATATRRVAYATGPSVEKTSVPNLFWGVLAVVGITMLGLWLGRSRASIPSTAFGFEEQVRLAGQKGTAALGALEPGFTAQELASALNLNVINFPTGSAQIPADEFDFLNRVALAIKSAPANTVLEIDGHTDNIGEPPANLLLSQKRAEAVRNYLVQQGVNPNTLIPKGYGDTRPLESNGTEQGKFRNRRIQFTVQ
jgi:outer membrane protein OmpA-like peptidoglycan-associated protein